MPKSKRARPVFLHGPKKKTRGNKDSLITNVQEALEKYQYVFVLEVRNMRNTALKDVRREFSEDGRYVVCLPCTALITLRCSRPTLTSFLNTLPLLIP
jgi:hypothetical protein